SAGAVSTEPARRDVLYRRRAGRLRAHESAWRRFHDAPDGRDGLQDRHGERYLRQSDSDHAIDALDRLTEKIDERACAVRPGPGPRSPGKKGRREVDTHPYARPASP